MSSSILEVLPFDMVEDIMKCLDARTFHKTMTTCKSLSSSSFKCIGETKLKRIMRLHLQKCINTVNKCNRIFEDKKQRCHVVLQYIKLLLDEFCKIQKTKKINDDILIEFDDLCCLVQEKTTMSDEEAEDAIWILGEITPNASLVYEIPNDLLGVYKAVEEYIVGRQRTFRLIFNCEKTKSYQCNKAHKFKYNKYHITVEKKSGSPSLSFNVDGDLLNRDKFVNDVYHYLHNIDQTTTLDNREYIRYPSGKLKDIVDALHIVYGNDIFTDTHNIKKIDIDINKYNSSNFIHIYDDLSEYYRMLNEYEHNFKTIKKHSSKKISIYSQVLSPMIK